MKLYLWGGFLMIILAILLSLVNYKQHKVQRDGVIVNMQIVKIPASCIGTKVKHYAMFLYNGVTYIKDVGPSFCDKHYIGENIDMRYLEGESVILYPGESVSGTFYMLLAVALGGLALIIYYIIKK